ncbi:DUF1850 domain-containing protein [Fusibacter sp. 3D3]|nr:DUF1850 domain-containing protein [Fusibacter sp. 3D3]
MKGKPRVAFPSLKKGMTFIGIGIMILGIFIWTHRELKLVISHQETGEVYLTMPVHAGDLLTYEWIHSFEHIPWYEDFRIIGESCLDLEEIRVAGFGAGIPENKGTVTVKEGMVYMSNIHEIFKEIQWINSQTANQYIAVNDKPIIRGSELPHHEPILLKIERRFQLWRKPQ